MCWAMLSSPQRAQTCWLRSNSLHVTGEVELPGTLEAAFFAIPELECGKVVHEDALPKQTRAKAMDEETDPDTVTLSGIQLTL